MTLDPNTLFWWGFKTHIGGSALGSGPHFGGGFLLILFGSNFKKGANSFTWVNTGSWDGHLPNKILTNHNDSMIAHTT